jgi:tetratricopeptide (TPR) repeat protein
VTAGQIETQSALKEATERYEKGKYSEAVDLLLPYTNKNKKDADGFNLLGVCYIQLDRLKDAKKALEKATKMSPANAVYKKNLAYAFLLENNADKAISLAESSLKIDPKSSDANFIVGTGYLKKNDYKKAISSFDAVTALNDQHSTAYLYRTFAWMYEFGKKIGEGEKPSEHIGLLMNAKSSIETCLKVCKNLKNESVFLEWQEATDTFYKYFEKRTESFPRVQVSYPLKRVKKNKTQGQAEDPTTVVAPVQPEDPTVKKLKILSKPRPSYTQDARVAGIQGVVTLAVLFAANKSKFIVVVSPLSHGLTEAAVAAAKQIAFEPQEKDGKPISVVKLVQFSFTLY